jgi:hypothetical protein
MEAMRKTIAPARHRPKLTPVPVSSRPNSDELEALSMTTPEVGTLFFCYGSDSSGSTYERSLPISAGFGRISTVSYAPYEVVSHRRRPWVWIVHHVFTHFS